MSCQKNQDCPFLYYCSEDKQCQHQSVFTLNLYTIFIYILIPFACGLVNTTGNSMGIFKVLIVMNLLRYSGAQATMIAQALVVGSALPNYISILIKKHPSRITSLVNFNLVIILIPCSLLGSTLGALISSFIPILFQDILICIVFSYFALRFYRRYQQTKNKIQRIQKQSLLSNQTENINSQTKQNTEYSSIHQKQQINFESKEIKQKQNTGYKEIEDNEKIQSNQNQQPIDFFQEKQKLFKYQKSIHLKDILFSFSVLLIFQFLVFVVQGQFYFLSFGRCDYKYYLGLFILIILTIFYLKLIKLYLKKKFQFYEKLNYEQDVNLNKQKSFNFTVAGGFLAGLTQGILGLGSCTCIMAFLLQLNVNSTSASATSGYQVLFIGFAALVQGFISGDVKLSEIYFFLFLAGIFGGLVTYFISKFLKNKNQIKVSKILIFIIFSLCLMSVIMVIPSLISNYLEFGWKKLISIKFSC